MRLWVAGYAALGSGHRMKIDVQINLKQLKNRVASKQVQDFWINGIVIPRMKKYMPARDKQEPEKQLVIGGASHKNGLVTIKGPQMQYLYYGKVMVGKPKKAIDKDLRYTTTINRQAGPFWDRRLEQHEHEQMEKELLSYRERGNR